MIPLDLVVLSFLEMLTEFLSIGKIILYLYFSHLMCCICLPLHSLYYEAYTSQVSNRKESEINNSLLSLLTGTWAAFGEDGVFFFSDCNVTPAPPFLSI